jgi:23S rRNA (pseudouridine1915-N3)-methyltransferase
LRITVIAVGKIKEAGLREVIDEYFARMRRHVTCEEIELREGKTVADAMRAAIPSGSHVVALEVDGQMLDSPTFSQRVVQWGSTGKGSIVFLIGGADGLPRAISNAADSKLSMSKMTLPHRVARLVLAEQLYRAISIWRGEPYHR